MSSEDCGEGVFVVAAGGTGGVGRKVLDVGGVRVVLACVDGRCWAWKVELCGGGRGVLLQAERVLEEVG